MFGRAKHAGALLATAAWRARVVRLVLVLAAFALLKHALGLGEAWRYPALRAPTAFRPTVARPLTPRLHNPARAFVVVSSDDWGRWTDAVPLFPDSDFASAHADLQVAPETFWYRRVSAETADDLRKLRDTLRALNAEADRFEQRIVLTPHMIVGGPDFDAMRQQARPFGTACDSNAQRRAPADADCAYRELTLSDSMGGLAREPFCRGDLRPLYHELFRAGLWHPEYHGRSHFAVSRWLDELNEPGSIAQACFNNSLVCSRDTMSIRSEFDWFAEHQDLRRWVAGGVAAFERFWGYAPRLISSPHNTWTPWLADAAASAGFVAASLGDEQRLYDMDAGMSVDQRVRFDAFFPKFECGAAIDNVVRALNGGRGANAVDVDWRNGGGGKVSLRTRAALSTSHGIGARAREQRRESTAAGSLGGALGSDGEAGAGAATPAFLSLMWHAQNAMQSTYAPDEYSKHMECFMRLVRTLRERVPYVTFLTGYEWHQVRARGWSVEAWPGSLVYRNYLHRSAHVQIDDIAAWIPTASAGAAIARNGSDAGATTWHGRGLVVELLNGAADARALHEMRVGQWLELPPDVVYRVRAADYRSDADSAAPAKGGDGDSSLSGSGSGSLSGSLSKSLSGSGSTGAGNAEIGRGGATNGNHSVHDARSTDTKRYA